MQQTLLPVVCEPIARQKYSCLTRAQHTTCSVRIVVFILQHIHKCNYAVAEVCLDSAVCQVRK